MSSTELSTVIDRHIDVNTTWGPIRVDISGNTAASDEVDTAIVSYPDLGLNARESWTTLYTYDPEKNVLLRSSKLKSFHINPPMMEENAEERAYESPFYSMDDLIGQVHEVVKALNLKRIILLGCGFGALVLTKYYLQYKKESAASVRGLICVSPVTTDCSLREWATHGTTTYTLAYRGCTESIVDWFLARWFSARTRENNQAISFTYRNALTTKPAYNLMKAVQSFARRSGLQSTKPEDFPIDVLLVVGTESEEYTPTLAWYEKSLSKERTHLIRTHHAGVMVQEEDPAAVLSAMKLFLQGNMSVGY